MPLFTVKWIDKMSSWAVFDCETEEQALEAAKAGRYVDVDTDDTGRPTNFRVYEGVQGASRKITKL